VEKVLAARERGSLLRQQCVLMRNSHHSDVLELELTRRNIPYVKYGGLKFLEAAHVKDALAVLRWAANPKHRLAAFRVVQLLSGVGPANADRCLKVFEASGYEWNALAQYQMPAAARDEWKALLELLDGLRTPELPWEGQMNRVRQWYEPHLARIYESAAARSGDIEQLERIATQYASRDEFLTELTLDPPQATSDFAGPPLIDEDYLILSTIHSAKGQEWNSVYVLNVTDGTFPSEFATGKPELIEEERRLLYVAMTRARHELHLITPLKYYITQQSRAGDAHLYGARSRFLTSEMMQRFECVSWPGKANAAATKGAAALPRIDAAGKIRDMW
jgi:DNA helicase-2/ATP-dependent DNA helicase PcrA